MNLNHLRAFVKVVQTRSYKEAATLLKVSQPAITQRIQALEEHFKMRLIVRSADGVQVTTQGENVYTQAQVILHAWDELERRMLGHKLEGKMIVGASTIPSQYLLPKLIRSFRIAYPDILIETCISGSHEVTRWLQERKVDLCITGEPENRSDFVSFPVFADQLVVIVPADYDGNARITTFSDLFQLEWVVREPQSDTRKAWEREVSKWGYDVSRFKVVGQMGSTDAVIAAVEAGMGASVISSLAVDRALQQNRVQVVQIDGLVIHRVFYVSCLRENSHSPLHSAFISYLNGREDI
ncbi:selenium metabolism-associated LysR family transcriptional regulator [Brevibacillus sp. WF146]|uniref:selenium metabolism-associated LysR family transcriptional regulator n=1 Tax=Brevibacillus sp. WF146 TaxID=319501 RepID=UPI0007ED9F84|nr:selenium metabolism-associated LysR family transcriptional regulator [Brevibacillus sp. WF146]UYZ12614.1 selenium metabolism-associated LysR family transcriptional regulator [Brevibacillus sp. WF146]